MALIIKDRNVVTDPWLRLELARRRQPAGGSGGGRRHRAARAVAARSATTARPVPAGSACGSTATRSRRRSPGTWSCSASSRSISRSSPTAAATRSRGCCASATARRASCARSATCCRDQLFHLRQLRLRCLRAARRRGSAGRARRFRRFQRRLPGHGRAAVPLFRRRQLASPDGMESVRRTDHESNCTRQGLSGRRRPGAPDLLTLRAAEVLKRADIVFHDALVHPEVLALAARAEKIAVGKRCGRFATAQQFINKRLVDAAAQVPGRRAAQGRRPHAVRTRAGRNRRAGSGRRGVRSRAGRHFGAVAAAAEAHASLTQRGVARSVAFVTPRVAAGEAPSAWAKCVAAADTAVIYMGVGQAAGHICRAHRRRVAARPAGAGRGECVLA